MRTPHFSRRRFLHSLGQAGLAAALPHYLFQASAASQSPPAFEEIPPSASGITWRHTAGLSPHMYMPETSGPGCAFLDYDNDGWMDIYLVNSGPCDFYQPAAPLRNALYRNNRDGTFTDVTLKAGVPGNAYGMGAAVGDYNNDGLPDLYVTQYPRSILYHNDGDGTFTDVTSKAGLAAPGWATSAVWFDYDNDGRLDLFVCQFVDFSKAKNIECGDGQLRWYCVPTVYPGAPCWLYHNNGDGTFTDVSRESGIAAQLAKAWGVVAADFNNDGWLDLFVANDKVANFLFSNRKGRFEDVAALGGVAYNVMGQARSGMGVDAADFDQDGWLDLFITNVDHEMFSLYRNVGASLSSPASSPESKASAPTVESPVFEDLAIPSGIGRSTMLFSGWGCRFFDYDNDGELDLLMCNGHPDTVVQQRIPAVSYAEPMLLFRNEGRRGGPAPPASKNSQGRPAISALPTWKNVSAESGPIFSKPLAARGLALGDFDNDGSVDVLVAVNDGPPVLLRNHAARQNHWLGLRLIGRKCNPDAIGARITYRSGDFQRTRYVAAGGSFLSAHDPRIVLGLGPRAKLDWLEVTWPQPSAKTQRFLNPPVDTYLTITEGDPKLK